MTMAVSSKSLLTLSDEHLIECYRLATQLELDTDFINQLKSEIDHRQITSKLQFNEHTYDPQAARI
ncbi:sporulation histidine kinase inhibitor Sda [Paenibacillus sp. GP183]|uniref:sporulation histidine kinase inhibitor Sda n=1 Tax=Paenibacillus sp. GP183 TaxID=1882751 RepID=UPI000B87F166|nr:sporulation histidine kinase inhibitor Sda [Paenibacillus sp. GP183]